MQWRAAELQTLVQGASGVGDRGGSDDGRGPGIGDNSVQAVQAAGAARRVDRNRDDAGVEAAEEGGDVVKAGRAQEQGASPASPRD